MLTDQKVELQDALSIILNRGNSSEATEMAECLLETLRLEHRTLQQNFWRVMQCLMTRYAEAPSDLRNEASVEWTRKASEVEAFFPYI
jgi:hypothetical protein